MKIMKKLIQKSKKMAAAVLLAVMAVCAITPAVQARITMQTVIGSRQGNSARGYRSHTQVRGYDEKGNPYNITVISRIGKARAEDTKKGEVIVNTNYISSAEDARHTYYVGGSLQQDWYEN